MMLLAAGSLTFGCGGDRAANESIPAGWTAAAAIPTTLTRDFKSVGTVERARGLIRHQREEHCHQRLIAVRCTPSAMGWTCLWQTDDGTGRTTLLKAYGDSGIPVTC
jgi:hypothetical protein